MNYGDYIKMEFTGDNEIGSKTLMVYSGKGYQEAYGNGEKEKNIDYALKIISDEKTLTSLFKGFYRGNIFKTKDSSTDNPETVINK